MGTEMKPVVLVLTRVRHTTSILILSVLTLLDDMKQRKAACIME